MVVSAFGGECRNLSSARHFVSITYKAVSCERRNISAIIRPRGSGEARCSVNEQTMEGD